MRPLKLTMSAFGPYRDEQTVDFTDLGNSGVFLISGKTGAGKTSIFDAISYALFGKITSEDRKTDRIRSDFAGDDTKTCVTLEFMHRNRRYTVTRTPAQTINKQRGQGKTPLPQAAELQEEDDVPVSGVTKVNGRIEELLGINYNQFKQIAMIAQGEFRKLLTAKSSDRKAIFQKVFMTEKYAQLESLIMDRSRKLDADSREMKSRFKSEIDRILLREESEAKIRFDEIGSEAAVNRLEDVFEIISISLDEDRKESGRLDREIKRLEDTAKSLENELTRATEENRMLSEAENKQYELDEMRKKDAEMAEMSLKADRIETAKNRIKPALDASGEADDALEKSRDEYYNIQALMEENEDRIKKIKSQTEDDEELLLKADSLDLKAAELDEERKNLSRRLDYEKEAEIVGNESGALEAEIRSVSKSAAHKEAEADSMLEKTGTISEDILSLSAMDAESVKTADIIEMCGRHMKEEERLGKLEEDYENAKREFLEKRDAFEEARDERDSAERLLEENRAGILAAALEENRPCPVCGSLHHPDPAPLADRLLTESEYKELSERCKELRKEKDSSNGRCVKLNSQLESGREHNGTLMKDILNGLEGIKEDISGTSEEISACLEERKLLLDERMEALESQIEEKKNMRDELVPKLREEARRKRETAEEKKNERQNLIIRLAELKTLISENPSSRYDTVSEYDDEIKTQKLEADRIRKEVKSRAEELAEAEKSKSNLDGQLKTHEEQLERAEKEAVKKADILSECIEEAGFSDAGEARELLKLDEKLIRDRVKSHAEKENELETQIKTLMSQTSGSYVETSGLEDRISINRDETAEYRGQKSSADMRISSNEKTLETLEKLSRDNLELTKQVGYTETLKNLIRGNTKSGTKMSLEEFVQVAGFDGIIHAANLRLRPISSGQFELFRTENTGNTPNMALSLEILDNYTGKRRPVNTLSGGESFKAALSMALGLSDYITSGLGGIEIDTLFIDEGFGSLDEQSVIEAIDMLNSLSTNGKLIGIISHREELKERITKKIIINKTPAGSSISMDLGE